MGGRGSVLVGLAAGLILGVVGVVGVAPSAGARLSYVPPQDSYVFEPVTAGGWLRPDGPALWANGSAVSHFDLPEAAAVFHFTASADVCEGPPHVRVRIDGEVVFDSPITTTRFQSVNLTGDWATGPHTLAFNFSNDHRTASCDRNVKIYGVTFSDTQDFQTTLAIGGNDLTLTPPGAGKVYSYGGGRPALVIWSNATASSDQNIQESHRFSMFVRGSDCDGPAIMTASVDGEVVVEQPLAERRTVLNFYGTWAAGARHVEVTFANDRLTADCDRNLYIYWIQFDGE